MIQDQPIMMTNSAGEGAMAEVAWFLACLILGLRFGLRHQFL
jgi:hypothetical protein